TGRVPVLPPRTRPGSRGGREWRCPHQRQPSVHRPPRLIAQLLSHAATTRGHGLLDVAEAIGVDETTLMQYRSGRRRLSMQSFANILAVYGDDRSLRDAAVHYACVEYHPPKPDSMEAAADALSVPAVHALRAY